MAGDTAMSISLTHHISGDNYDCQQAIVLSVYPVRKVKCRFHFGEVLQNLSFNCCYGILEKIPTVYLYAIF